MMIVVPAVTFYLIFFMYLQGQDLKALQENKQGWLLIGLISMIISIYLQLFVAHASKQLLNKKKVNFSQAMSDAFKDYLKGIALYLIFIIPFDGLAVFLGTNSVIGTILILIRLFIYFVIAPAIVLNKTLKAAVIQMLKLFNLRKFFELSGMISLVIIWFIVTLLLVGMLKIELLLPFIVGFFMTYLNMMVFYYLFQTRGKVC